MMRNSVALHYMVAFSFVIPGYLLADAADPVPVTEEVVAPKPASFQSFTGKVTKSRIRLRSQPTLDSSVIRELHRDDLLVIVGESADFYAIKAPSDVKGYIFRTFVLDGVVEGSHVNVRLSPDLDAPILTQLNTGDKVQGKVSSANHKWLEIQPPENLRFYVAKEYIEKVGDASMLTKMEKRRTDVNKLLADAERKAKEEIEKNFEQMNIDPAVAAFNKIVQQYPEFPTHVSMAKEWILRLQDTQLQKKIAHLEADSKKSSEQWQAKQEQLHQTLKVQQDTLTQQQARLKDLEHSLEQEKQMTLEKQELARKEAIDMLTAQKNALVTNRMNIWQDAEQEIYTSWKNEHGDQPMEAFYLDEKNKAITVTGVVEQYDRPVKNKPGDFLLVTQADSRPIAYLYSTTINLQDHVGKSVTLSVAPRPNTHFAFPAYYVLSAP